MLTNEERQILQIYGVDAEQQRARRAALPTGMIDAYRSTHFLIHAGSNIIDVRAGERSPSLDRWLETQGVDSWAFVTAWNPHSAPLSLEDNNQRQAALCAELGREGLAWVPGEGVSEDGHWREPSVMITQVTFPWAEALGARYGQNAIVIGRRHSPAAIIFTDICLSQ
jgi:hypothetical protein